MEVLTGKVAVITGAAKRLGFALATALAEEGMRLVLADIDEADLERAARQLRDRGTEVLSLPTDVSDSRAIELLRDYVYERFETVHVLCNNAGVSGGWSVSEPVDLAPTAFDLGMSIGTGVAYVTTTPSQRDTNGSKLARARR